MTAQGAKHIIDVLVEVRSKLMQNPDPILMERIQESVVLCREEIAKKQEKVDGV